MACTEPLNDLPVYLRGALDTEGERRLRAHINTCPICQERMAGLLRPPWERMEAALFAELSEKSSPIDSPPPPRWGLRARSGTWLSRAIPVRRISLVTYAVMLAAALLWSPSRDEVPHAAHAASSEAVVEAPAAPDIESFHPTITYLPHHGSL